MQQLPPKVNGALRALIALSNGFINAARIQAIWKPSIVIPTPKPKKYYSQCTSYRPMTLICPTVKVLKVLVLPQFNAHLHPAPCSSRFPTRTLYNFCTTTTKHRFMIQPGKNLHIKRSVLQSTWWQHSIQFAITLLCTISLDRLFWISTFDGCRATFEVDKQEQAAEE